MPANPCPTMTHDTVPVDIPVDLGDFVCTDDEDEIEDESEDTLQYLFGVYYPVRIGDVFHRGRYQVIHKLGRGGFSTVWLAYDRKDGKDVALKILSSTETAAKEGKTHDMIKQRVQDHSRIVLSQDHFLLTRVDRSEVERRHHVLVLPLRGPSLLNLLHTEKRPLSDRMSAAKQLLQAVLSIHNAGLVHRDIVLGNVVYGLKVDLGKMSVPEKYKLLGRPRKAKALWEEGQEGDEPLVIGELVAPANFPPEILGSDAHLCDFGILVEAGTSVPNKLQSQRSYCAPELFHDIEPSFASDMWSYMVVFVYLYTEKAPFPIGPGFAGVLGSIVDGVGLLPEQWNGRYAVHDKTNTKESWYGQGSKSKSIFSAFLDKHRPTISTGEKALVLSVIQQVFRPRPEDRVTASELLGNKDFNALMSIYGVQ